MFHKEILKIIMNISRGIHIIRGKFYGSDKKVISIGMNG